jgi:hypothetical protein
MLDEYELDPAEWAAAKAYYLNHQAVIDARRILNEEETEAPSGVTTLADLLAQTSPPESTPR